MKKGLLKQRGASAGNVVRRSDLPGRPEIRWRYINEGLEAAVVGSTCRSSCNRLRGDPVPAVYQAYLADLSGPIHFAIRTTMDSARLAEAVRMAVASGDPAVPLTEFHTETGLIDRLLRTERLLAFLSGAFGLAALALAAIGIAGLLAYSVARQTRTFS